MKKQKNEGFLKRFLAYDRICIQCHDNPDSDALASGYALYDYFEKQGKQVRFIYGGAHEVQKSNLLMMIKELQIPVEYETEGVDCDLLITVDCQYGSGNVTRFEAPHIGMIDHHQCGIIPDEDCYIRSNLASCSTILWDLLRQEGIDVNEEPNLSTALYYGLYIDSNQFEELYHPLDRDMRDDLKKNEAVIFRMINSNLSIEELEIAGNALSNQSFSEEGHFSIIESEPCDPNILGIISDFVIQVQEIDACIAYNRTSGGYKLSVRSCVPEIKSNELAVFLCEGVGNGGGHLKKAGGFVSQDLFEKTGCKDLTSYLTNRMEEYLVRYEIIDAATYEIDASGMEHYCKKAVTIGCVRACDMIRPGTPILVRTLEGGDIDLVVEEDLYLMIGIEGEVYPIKKEKFDRSYVASEEEPEIETEYPPTVKNTVYGTIYQLMDYMKPCMATGQVGVKAKKLGHGVKVFTAWDKDQYYRGEPGDYLVVREDDDHDIYVVREKIFHKTYQLAEEGD